MSGKANEYLGKRNPAVSDAHGLEFQQRTMSLNEISGCVWRKVGKKIGMPEWTVGKWLWVVKESRVLVQAIF